MFYFSVQLLPEIFLNLRRLSANITINVGTFQVKYPLFLSEINETWIFSTDLRKNTEIPSFMKIRPVGAEFFHADRTDGRIERHDEANSRKTLLCCHKSTHRWGKYLIPTHFFFYLFIRGQQISAQFGNQTIILLRQTLTNRTNRTYTPLFITQH